MRPATATTTRKRAAARAFTLIELALAMFIFGLLISSILGPAADLYERNKNSDANAYLDRASRAVMDYALRNRTAYREITYDGVPAVIPAGRPYLPCPDIDGDGIENRLAITAAIVIDATSNLAGTCASQKGTIPWRTLQLTPIGDPWRNHLTYHVDFAYSNALLGFDETSRADRHDLTRIVDAMGIYEAREGSNAPIAICDKPGNGGGECNPTTTNQGNIIGGVTLSVTTSPPPYDYDPANIFPHGLVHGAVFVLVSHGANGSHARRSGGGCHGAEVTNLSTGSTNPHERRNGYHACGGAGYSGLTGGNFQDYYFSYPISEDPQLGEFDDILRWVMVYELMGALSDAAKERDREPTPRNLLPIPKLQFLP